MPLVLDLETLLDVGVRFPVPLQPLLEQKYLSNRESAQLFSLTRESRELRSAPEPGSPLGWAGREGSSGKI